MSDASSRPSSIEESAAHGWVATGSFLGSILAGTLLGYLGDLWLGTKPWLIVIGIVAGSYAGFVTMWNWSKRIDLIERKRP
jgi:ATP synthase protein I